MIRFFFKVFVFLQILMNASYGATEEITPSDVFKQASILEMRLKLIYQEMGLTLPTNYNINVFNAEPREVYYQAISLFNTSNQLFFEFTGKQDSRIVQLKENIAPKDVLKVLKQIDEMFFFIERELKIKYLPQEIKVITAIPDMVFKKVTMLNHQVSDLLDVKTNARDVYYSLNFAVDYSKNLLKKCTKKDVNFILPEYVGGKTAKDMFMYLLDMFQIVKNIAKSFDIKTMDIVYKKDKNYNVTSNDVLVLSNIIVSELAYLNFKIGESPKMERTSISKKIISNNYQLVRGLKEQLNEIVSCIAKNPDFVKINK